MLLMTKHWCLPIIFIKNNTRVFSFSSFASVVEPTNDSCEYAYYNNHPSIIIRFPEEVEIVRWTTFAFDLGVKLHPKAMGKVSY